MRSSKFGVVQPVRRRVWSGRGDLGPITGPNGPKRALARLPPDKRLSVDVNALRWISTRPDLTQFLLGLVHCLVKNTLRGLKFL